MCLAVTLTQAYVLTLEALLHMKMQRQSQSYARCLTYILHIRRQGTPLSL